MESRSIPASTKKDLQNRKQCANTPSQPAVGCERYACPLWLIPDNQGCFDESGFQIDHIKEYSHGGTNDINNLQVLCPCCHAVKTRRFMKQNRLFDSHEIRAGRARMETDKPPTTLRRGAKRPRHHVKDAHNAVNNYAIPDALMNEE